MSDDSIEDEVLKLTPEDVVNKDFLFSIPLYQRLFEWTENEIVLLLSNLSDAYKNPDRPYYIGLLTAFVDKDNLKIYSLVDGQQRLTVMTLFSIVMGKEKGCEKWQVFHTVKDKGRLSFFAREDDNTYLNKLRNSEKTSEGEYVNNKMQKGLACIEKYLGDNYPDEEKRKDFINYIFQKMTFFISILPPNYSLADLNKYFEAMNSTGKSLESYEQLKVDLLRKLPTQNGHKEEYTRIWNVVSDLNTEIVRKREKESYSNMRKRLQETIYLVKNGKTLELFNKSKEESFLNDIYKVGDEKNKDSKYKSIGEIEESKDRPNYEVGTTEEKTMFSFPVFLLLVLYQMLPSNDKSETNGGIKVAEFFKISNLRKTFDDNLSKIDVSKFFENLLLYRLYLDCFLIRINEKDRNYPYTLKFYVYDDEPAEEGEKDDIPDEEYTGIDVKGIKNQLRHFQSMLHVSSTALTYYRWINPIFTFFDSHIDAAAKSIDFSPEEFLKELKTIDNNIHPMPEILQDNECENLDDKGKHKLSYPDIDRYWFWRTDYYLWEKRDEYFKDQSARKVVENYVFKRNTSIEHIAPQHPQDNADDEFKWDENTQEIENCFGNLCLISSGQNSRLQNRTFNTKKGYVQDFINESLVGSIESLKMLEIYTYDKWTKDTIEEHRDKMFKLLKDSYNL